jgi:hypothetical protein
MKRTYAIVTGAPEGLQIETMQRKVDVERIIRERGIELHPVYHLAGQLIHKDNSGNDVMIFQSRPVGLMAHYTLSFKVDDEDSAQLTIPGTGA